MKSVDFYSNVTRLHLNKLKLGGIKVPPQSEGTRLTKSELRYKEKQRMSDLLTEKLQYQDISKYITDYTTS
jgi:hypothetical protein